MDWRNLVWCVVPVVDFGLPPIMNGQRVHPNPPKQCNPAKSESSIFPYSELFGLHKWCCLMPSKQLGIQKRTRGRWVSKYRKSFEKSLHLYLDKRSPNSLDYGKHAGRT